MSGRFTIQVGDTQVSAQLLEEEAPQLSQCMWENLPIEGFSVHAKFAGREIIVMVPFYAEPENEILNVQPGDIGYYPGRQTICIFYGDTQPFGYVSVFARIVDGLDRLMAAGDQLLREGMLPVNLTREEDERDEAGHQTQHGLKAESGSTGTAFTHLLCGSSLEPDIYYERALGEQESSTAHTLSELRAFLTRNWRDEPADIAALRPVSRPPMGNLPCSFYANFNLFWLGEELQVCRQQVKDGIIPLQMVCQVIAGLLERHAARLEKWSMTETVALVRTLARYFKGNSPATTEEFLAAAELAMLALDRVQSWIDGLLPWNELDSHLSLHRPINN
ncbi:MAG TPA: cyclophilin-like fold protein [Ktedonobacteraceae bacterium]|nr:cyclophilin-like fold protein [Ktedonobacteraceae bacterium]